MKIKKIEKKNNDEYLIRFEGGNIAFWGREFLKDKLILELTGLCQEIVDKGFNIYDNPNEPLVKRYREIKRIIPELN